MADPSAFAKDPNFMTAVERARMIASKLASQAPPGSGGGGSAPSSVGGPPMMNSMSTGQKRSFDDEDEFSSKRPNMMNDVAAKIHDFRQMSSGGGGGGGGSFGGSGGGGGFGGGKSSAVPKLGERPVLEGIIENGEKTQDMMIPGNKVGYIIGKGGEQIRKLQDENGVRMTIFQQTNDASEREKQLRIMGPPDRVDRCIEAVNRLLEEKEMEFGKMGSRGPGMSRNGGPGGHNDYGSPIGGGRGNSREVTVPPSFIGLVIGKGGESIKRIQQESMTKIQFDTTKSDAKGNKICTIFGPGENVRRAEDMIQEIIENAAANRRSSDGRNNSSNMSNNFHGGEEVRMTVPANRTGAVIGRGGESIRLIKQQSGCDIELDKMSKTMGGDEKVFIIRGPLERIPVAQQLITEKIKSVGRDREQREPSPPRDPNAFGACSGDYSWSNYVAAEHGLYSGAVPLPSTVTDSGQDPSAQWAAYYAQMYAQQGAVPGAPAASSSSATPNSSAGGDAPTNGAPQPGGGGGDQDYTAQWAAYYRAYGMEKEAQQIEEMARSKGQGGSSSQDSGNQSSSAPSGSYGSAPVGYPSYSGYNNQNSGDKS